MARTINKIILHCSATRKGLDIKAATIKRWHVQGNGWKDIGYHYVIDLDGTVEKGRSESTIGAHCNGQNRYSIGVCYVGGLDKDGKKAEDTRTEAQKAAMYELVDSLLKKYRLSIGNVYCHNQFAAKACPCFEVEKFKEEYAAWSVTN